MYADSQPFGMSTKERVKARVRHSVDEGNRRRLIICRKGSKLVEMPLTIAVVATVVAPVLAAIAAVAVAFFETTIEVQPVEQLDDMDGSTL